MKGVPSILLVSMPWFRADAPSFQLGLLKAALVKKNIGVGAWHGAPFLARKLGQDLYWRAANNIHPLLSEAVFAYPFRPQSSKAAIFGQLQASEEFSDTEIHKILGEAAAFMEDLENSPPWRNFDAVGFSCTFNQLQASLWAAKIAKKQGLRIVFGGFLASGDMGRQLLANDCIDAVISGFGEDALPAWLAAGAPCGMYSAANRCATALVPDYDDFFAASTPDEAEECAILLEASRGCERGACSFCAQNWRPGRNVHNRDFTIRAIRHCSEKYPCHKLEFADTSFPLGLFPQKNVACGFKEVFAECRAPDADELEALRAFGITSLQVGIESFHTDILRVMRKGAGLLENIFCLRQAWNIGMDIKYNIILEMPGTKPGALVEMLAFLPLLHHLQPPAALVPFQLQKNSHVFNNPEKYGLTDIAPHPLHGHLNGIHPHFYFTFTNKHQLPHALLAKAHASFCAWHNAFKAEQPLCTANFYGEKVRVRDDRAGSMRQYELRGAAAALLGLCLRPKTISQINAAIPDSEAALLQLADLNLVINDENRWLSLPVAIFGDGAPPPMASRDGLNSWFAP